MSERQYFLVSGILFTIVGIAHLARVVYEIPVLIGSYELPTWVSVAGVIIPVFLAIAAFRLLRTTEDDSRVS